jgi:hypothetical protein
MGGEERFQNAATVLITDFLEKAGIVVVRAKLSADTFLPGISVQAGELLVDEERLLYPGDLLHEAGHLAVAPAVLRKLLSDEVEVPGFHPELLEAQSIAWSYAACLHIGLDPCMVFHEGGYKGNSEGLLLNFSLGIFIGVEQLEEAGMTVCAANAESAGTAPYPAMTKWCRD